MDTEKLVQDTIASGLLVKNAEDKYEVDKVLLGKALNREVLLEYNIVKFALKLFHTPDDE